MKLLGQRVRLCRKLLGMTQTELAGDDFTKSFISQIECGHAVPSIRTLLILAVCLASAFSIVRQLKSA